LFTLFVSKAYSKSVTDIPAASAPADQAVTAINAFAIDVYRQLAAENGNVFFSPYSISSAMTMVYAGARGDTAAEMEKTLHFEGRGPEIHAAMKALQDRYDSIPVDNGIFSVANRLWLDTREKLTPYYTLLVEKNYGAGVEQVDFFNSHERARLEINDWVAQRTRDKIKDLLQRGDVSRETILVCVNAVYFNSAWLMPFDKSETKEEPFSTGKDKRRNVSMMGQQESFLYGENTDAQWIRIPYKINGYSMVVFLPRENESFTQLTEFESKLSVETLTSWIADMQYNEVKLHMPKFKDERRYLLADVLKVLGMKLAFSNDADFSGLVEESRKNGQTVQISSVIHQAFIELDEESTEAAAATAVTIVRTSMIIDPEPVKLFRANHPFMYCLMDDTGTILFIGRMADPK